MAKDVRPIITLVGILLIWFPLSACNLLPGSQNSTPIGIQDSSQSVSAIVENADRISVMLFDRGKLPAGQGTLVDNRWTRWVNEQMALKGIQVDYIPVARSEEATRIPVMVATLTAADLMMTYDNAMVRKFYDDGLLLPLDELLADNGKDVQEYVGQECLDLGRDDAGTLFAIPARRATLAAYNLFIRKDWLDILNLPIPETIDQLYETLKLFKEKDPGGVGQDNVIASSVPAASIVLVKSFLTQFDETEYAINSVDDLAGQCYADQAGGLAYFTFRNKLYNEGLTDREFFLRKDFSLTDEAYASSGRLGFWEYSVNGNVDSLRGSVLQTLRKTEPAAELVSLPPLRNIWDGQIYNPSYPLAGAFLFIPETAEHPEAVMTYLDFLAGEGGFTIFHGFEGEHIKMDGNIPVVIDSEYNALTKDWIRHDLFIVGNQGYYRTEQDFFAASAREIPGWESYVLENYENATTGIRVPISPYISPTQTREAVNIQKIFDDYAIKLITCPPEQVDQYYAEMLSEFKRYGMDTILQERRDHYQNSEN